MAYTFVVWGSYIYVIKWFWITFLTKTYFINVFVITELIFTLFLYRCADIR